MRSFRRQNRWTEGWAISGVARFTTGFPVTLYNNNDTSLLGTIPNGINNNGVDTPDFTPGNLEINTHPENGRQPSTPRSSAFQRWVRSAPPAGGFSMDRESATSISRCKSELRLSESKSLQFRLETFNVFNHTQFYGPAAVNGNISSADFGQVVSAAPPRLLQLAAKFLF